MQHNVLFSSNREQKLVRQVSGDEMTLAADFFRSPIVFGMLILSAIILALSVTMANAQDRALSDRAKGLDANNNGLVDKGEARGPLAANFSEMDCDKNGGLDGAEIRGFFTGSGCPKPATVSASVQSPFPPLSERAKGLDANNNGLVDKGEARGPLAANFDEMDCDKNGGLDGAEIPAFFQGTGCPKKSSSQTATKAPVARASKPKRSKKGDKRSGLGGGRPPQAVRLDTVELETTNETYAVIGRVAALQSGLLAARVNGAVVSVNVDIGDRVVKGAVVARLAKARLSAERRRIAAQVARHKAMLQNAEREMRRMSNLSQSAAFSRARYEDQLGLVAERKAHLAEFNAALERLNIDLRNATIRAPYDAIVTEKHVEAGGYVNVGSRVITLLNDKSLEVEVDVPSFRIAGLVLGTAAKVVLEGGKSYSAQVRSIIPDENVRTRTRPIRLKVDFGLDAAKLADNQSVTVELPLTTGNEILTVHKDAVTRRANGYVVFVVDDSSAKMTTVELGRGVGNKFQVLKGLKAGDRVVIRGNERLGAGGRVKVIN